MSLAIRPVSAAVAVFAAAFAANANTTYYFQGTPGEETYIWDNTQWKTEDGTAKTLFQNSAGTRDMTADAVITNGQLAVTETAWSDKEFCFLGNTLTISGEESESILRHNGSSFSYADVILKGNGALYLSGRYSTSKSSGIANTTTIEIDPDTTEEKPAIIYLGDRTGNFASWAPIRGSGYLKFALKTGTAEKWMSLSADNTSYTGVVAVVGSNSKVIGLNGEAEGSLFGNPPEFLEKGLVLENGHAYFKYSGSLPANRGVYIKTVGGLGANSGITGTIDSVITFEDANAVLQKVGPGTVELAGGISDDSPAGTIYLSNGTLKMKAADASKVNFTGSYPLVLTGSGTASFDDTLSTFTSTLTMKDTSTLDLSNGANIAAAVTMESGTSLKLPALGTGAAAVRTLSLAANTPVTFGDGSPVPDGLYKVLAVTGSADASTVAQNLSCQNVASSGGAVSMFASGGDVYLAVGTAGQGDADICVWTGGGVDNLFSTQENWLGGREPVAGESLSSILFNNGSAGEAVNDVGDIGVAKIVLNSSGVTTVSNVSGYKFTGVTNITTAANVHHVFNCPVECKDGVTPVVPGAANNYVDFKGGLTASSLSNARSLHWCGNISITNTATWSVAWENNGSTSQVLDGNGSMFSAKVVGLGYFSINSAENVANTAKVEKIVYSNGLRYVNYNGNWACRWQCVASLMRSGAVLKVGEIAISGDVPEIFHSYAEDSDSYGESGVIEADKITLGSTKDTGTGWTDQRRPFFWLNRGRRYGEWKNNKMTLHNESKSGTWAIGSGGLAFSSSCNNSAAYKVASGGALLNSFADWTLAPHGQGAAKTALEIEGAANLEINTDHYVTGDPEIDNGAKPHTVTINGVITGGGSLLISGGGRVVFNSVSTFSSWMRVATELVLKPGSQAGASTMSLWNNGTLNLTSKGCVTLGSNITFGNGSTLKFKIHDNTDTNKLNAAFNLSNINGTTQFINVYVDSSLDYASLEANTYTLITQTGETELVEGDLRKFKLQGNGCLKLAIKDGNLIAVPKPYFFIRISENSTRELPVPLDWIDASGTASSSDSVENITKALTSAGANGIARWQSYCLGLSPTNAESVVLCIPTPDQPVDTGAFKFTTNVTVPQGVTGVVATAYLECKSGNDDWSQQGVGQPISNNSAVVFTGNADPGNALSFFV